MGNVVDPWEVLNKQGADAVRWYFYANGAPWLPTRFSAELVSEMQSQVHGHAVEHLRVLHHVRRHRRLQARRAEGRRRGLHADGQMGAVQAEFSLVKYVDEGLSEYKITETARAIQSFVDELSNWYVRLSKQRFWGKEWTGDKKAAYETLYTVLVTLSKVCAPYIPFMAESMYRNLVVGNIDGRAGIRASVRLPEL